MELTEEQIAEKLEAEEQAREQARLEHEQFLDSFPETTVFYQDIIEKDGYKVLAGTIRDPRGAEKNKILDNHMDVSELSVVVENGTEKFYLTGFEPVPESEEERRARLFLQKKTEITDAVQKVIDKTANKRGYDTGVSCVSYATSSNLRYHADAVEFSDWRDAVWDVSHDVENKVLAGELDLDDVSVEYVLERLPVLEW